MNRKFLLRAVALSLVTCLVFSLSQNLGSQAGLKPKTILGTYVNLAVVSIMVQDKNTGEPLTGLHKEDFEIFDSGHAVQPLIFINGSNPNSESLALWLVAECPLEEPEKHLSSNLAEKIDFLGRALEELNPQDTVGVAHLCGDGEEAKIDLAPTADRDAPLKALNAVLGQNPVKSYYFSKSRSVRKILQLIHSSTPTSQTLPIIVFLRSNPENMPSSDAERIARDIMTHTSALIFAINEAHASNRTAPSHVPLINYLSQETGGQVVTVRGDQNADLLGRFVAGVRARYTIAFFPPPTDGNWHVLKVRLTNSAIQKYGEAVVRSRSGYMTGGIPPHYTVSEIPEVDGDSLDPSLSKAIKAPVIPGDVPFEADGATYYGPTSSARFTLKLDDGPLSWDNLPDGNSHSKMTVVTAFLSAKGEAIQQKVQKYEIVRRKSDAWTVQNPGIVISLYVGLPENTDHARFLIRDDASGRLGTLDLPMKKILDAPKLQSIIAEEISFDVPPARRSSLPPQGDVHP